MHFKIQYWICYKTFLINIFYFLIKIFYFSTLNLHFRKVVVIYFGFNVFIKFYSKWLMYCKQFNIHCVLYQVSLYKNIILSIISVKFVFFSMLKFLDDHTVAFIQYQISFLFVKINFKSFIVITWIIWNNGTIIRINWFSIGNPDDTGPTLNVCKALILIELILHSYGFTVCESTKTME